MKRFTDDEIRDFEAALGELLQVSSSIEAPRGLVKLLAERGSGIAADLLEARNVLRQAPGHNVNYIEALVKTVLPEHEPLLEQPPPAIEEPVQCLDESEKIVAEDLSRVLAEKNPELLSGLASAFARFFGSPEGRCIVCQTPHPIRPLAFRKNESVGWSLIGWTHAKGWCAVQIIGTFGGRMMICPECLKARGLVPLPPEVPRNG